MHAHLFSITGAAVCACALLTGCAAKAPAQAQFLDWHGNILPADQTICGIWTQDYMRTLLAPVTYVVENDSITAVKQDGVVAPETMCQLTETLTPDDDPLSSGSIIFQLEVGVNVVGPASIKALPTGGCNQKLTGDYIYPADQGCGLAAYIAPAPDLDRSPTWASGTAWLRRSDLDVEVDDDRPGPYRDPVTDAITLVNQTWAYLDQTFPLITPKAPGAPGNPTPATPTHTP